jgi:hypothetical protein
VWRKKMPSNTGSPKESIQSSFKRLSAAASNLNAVSDELGKSVEELESSLQKLNLGVTHWVSFEQIEENNGVYWVKEVGYAKIGGTWGVALREASVHATSGDIEIHDQWLFKDAPRELRIASIDALPDLLAKLARKAEATASRIAVKVDRAREVAEALKTASSEAADGKTPAGR